MITSERLNSVATRVAAAAFGRSLSLFELQPAQWLARVRRRVRPPASPAGVPAPHRAAPATAAPGRRSGIPVVFIHRGHSEYLTYSLSQAAKSSPESTVFLLGDDASERYPNVAFHHAGEYSGAASEFGRIYAHFSTHPHAFELVCFQRWFILRDFLRAHRFDQCVYLDSDVLLYADVNQEMHKFRRFDLALCWHSIGCVMFVNALEGLERLCQFMTAVYDKTDRYAYDRIVAHYATRLLHGLPGGACDMTALQLFHEANFGRVGEASHIIDGSVYDPNINVANPGFAMADGIKKVAWRDGQPYGTFVSTGETIRFNALHFNGSAKSLMAQYCTAVAEFTERAAVATP